MNNHLNVNLVINNCQSKPCLNGATCTNAANKFSCSCVTGYTGSVCQTGKLKLLIIIVSYVFSILIIANNDNNNNIN